MNLNETLKAMEVKNIAVALDIGVHGECDINHNCPVAIQLRRIIQESGVTMEQLFDAFASIEQRQDNFVLPTLPSVDCNLHMNIMGKDITLWEWCCNL